MHPRGDFQHHYLIIILIVYSLILSSWMDIPGVEAAGGTFGGGDGSSGNPYVIEDVWDLQNMSSNLSANYTLGNDIDASATASWNSGAGFVPVGTNITPFTGSLDGRNHTISGLFIDRPTGYYVGLFGYMEEGSWVKNIGLIDLNVTGFQCTGGLIGYSYRGSVSGSYSSGNVTGTGYATGGLVGSIRDGTVDMCHSMTDVKGTNTSRWYGAVGGLVGAYSSGTLTNSHAMGDVTGAADSVGGLIGRSSSGDVSQCYATGEVLGATNYTGGLIGRNENTEVHDSHAKGNATGDRGVGGFVGYNAGGEIFYSYSTGEVSGMLHVGGFAGEDWSGVISDCYSTGNVTGNYSVGGLLGYYYRYGEISNTHYSIDDVSINGGHHLTVGGLFGAQYDDWYSNNLSLDISDNSTTLVPSGGFYDVSNLQGLRDLLGFADVEDYRFRLAADIDLSTAPGLYIPYLAAEFDGNDHVISNLRLNISFATCLGMFGITMENPVKNIGIVDCDIVGGDKVGGIVGMMRWDMITKSYATGRVVGGEYVGGLVGYGSATNCYASVNVTGQSYVGGFVGYLIGGHPTSGYATGTVTGDSIVGGFTGCNSWLFSKCYSSARVSGNEHVGGLTGYWGAGVVESFWDTEVSGQNESVGGTGKTTAEMKRRSTFTEAEWDFTNDWFIVDGVTYPLLRWQDRGSPKAAAGSDRAVEMGTLVTFDGSGSIDDLMITDYEWTFVDGVPVTLDGVLQTYRFVDPGVYKVTLKVMDGIGNSDDDNVTITVKDVMAPIADAGPDMNVDEGTLVTFDGSGSWDNVGIVGWTWTIKPLTYFPGDPPIVLYGETSQFLFGRPGTYEVRLTVMDAAGNLQSDLMNVTVHDITPPVASFALPSHVALGTSVVLDGDASTDNVEVTEYRWTIEGPDGTEHIEGMEVSFNADTLGEFVITLNVTDAAGNWFVRSETVTVFDDTEPVAYAGNDILSSMGELVTFDGSRSSDNVGIVQWKWSFEYDGTQVSLEGESASFSFDLLGLYTVILTVTDAAGNGAQDDVAVMIVDSVGPQTVVREDATIEQNTSLVLDGSNSTDNVGIVSYQWNIDGPYGPVDMNGQMVIFKFTAQGWYIVNLLVTDAAGNEDNALFFVEVTPTEIPNGNGGNGGGGNEEGYMLYIIIAIVVAIVVVGLVVYLKMGR